MTTRTSTLTDDRTHAQLQTHTAIVKGLDAGMSGWGGCPNGKSYAAWACEPQHLDTVYAWVEARGDITRLTTQWDETNEVKVNDHAHIYVVTDSHPALN